MLAVGYWTIIGAAVGSFVNVVAHRLPLGLSVLWPPSRCPGCKTALGVTENVPVLGWLWLRGKCRHCGMAISARYPLVELAGAILFALTAWRLGADFSLVSLVTVAFWGVFLAVLLALSLIDLDTMELPGELTSCGVVTGLVFRTFFPVIATGQWSSGPPGLMDALYGLLLGIGLFDVISYLGEKVMGKEAMGGGDATLAALIGVWLGWKLLLVSLAIAFVVGAVVGVLAIATGQIGRDQPMPFGPFLALGGIGGLLFGEILMASYTSFI